MNVLPLILIISFFLIAVLYRFNRAKIIGNIGEKKVSLRLHLHPDDYKIFDDIYLNINELRFAKIRSPCCHGHKCLTLGFAFLF